MKTLINISLVLVIGLIISACGDDEVAQKNSYESEFSKIRAIEQKVNSIDFADLDEVEDFMMTCEKEQWSNTFCRKFQNKAKDICNYHTPQQISTRDKMEDFFKSKGDEYTQAYWKMCNHWASGDPKLKKLAREKYKTY